MKSQSSMTKYYILAALSRKGMHGYELIMQIEKITGKKPSTGQVYPALKQMKSAGYVTAKTKLAGRKKVKSYKITKSGEQFFSSMSRRFESVIEAALKSRIRVCANCRCEIVSGAYRLGGKYFCCVSCASTYRLKR